MLKIEFMGPQNFLLKFERLSTLFCWKLIEYGRFAVCNFELELEIIETDVKGT